MIFDPTLTVLGVVQVAVFVWALRLARQSDSDALHELEQRFNPDIQSRATRGDGPDWVRYMDEADRVHEQRLDGIRTSAHAALVLGIGGTLAVLSLRLLGSGDPTTALSNLTDAIGPALLASLFGIVNNLAITLGLFRISDRRFAASLEEYRNALQARSDASPPTERFAEAVRDQLGNAFREAVRTFPEAFARLDESIGELSRVTERQSKAALEAAAELKSSADGLTSAARKVAPATQLLLASTERLHSLPDRLSQTLDTAMEHWEAEIRRDQQSFVTGVREVLDRQQGILEDTANSFKEWERQRAEVAEIRDEEWLNSMAKVEKAVATIASTVYGLPDRFTQEVQAMAGTLGKQFGLEARQHIQDLVRAIEKETEERAEQTERLMRDLHTRFLNDTSTVVAKTLEQVYRRVENSLLASLHDVGEELREAIKTLPENARGFAASLTQADTRLQRSLDALTKSADHLGRVARVTEEFQSSLTRALQTSTKRGFEPVLRRFEDAAGELHNTARKLDRANAPVRIHVEPSFPSVGWILQRIRRRPS